MQRLCTIFANVWRLEDCKVTLVGQRDDTLPLRLEHAIAATGHVPHPSASKSAYFRA